MPECGDVFAQAGQGLVLGNDRLLAHEETAQTRSEVRTASYAQIREKLYTRASGRWRRYADHLAPVMAILAPWIETMGYEA